MNNAIKIISEHRKLVKLGQAQGFPIYAPRGASVVFVSSNFCSRMHRLATIRTDEFRTDDRRRQVATLDNYPITG